jgi:hexosaminidase
MALQQRYWKMQFHLIVFAGLLALAASAQPLFVWPKPQQFTLGGSTVKVDKLQFQFSLSGDTRGSEILSKALDRHLSTIFGNTDITVFIDNYTAPAVPSTSSMRGLVVRVTNADETLSLTTDESYNLVIPGGGADGSLTANSVYGALRGLETFSQLVHWTGSSWIIEQVPLNITDFPRFAWRGFLLDTARHFHPVWSIQHVIDTLAYAKLNVLHWHITDAESFPLELQSRPEMAQSGAWASGYTYSATDVNDIIQYAKERGIRVVPEIDTPGHTYSWGKAHPEVIVNCPNVINKSKTFPNINSVALDLTNDLTYEVLKDVYQDTASMFADSFIHLGGDELMSSCYDEDPAIVAWMKAHNMSYLTNETNKFDYTELVRYYRYNVSKYVAAKQKNMVVWQEAYEEMFDQPANPLQPNNTIVQVWKNQDFGATLAFIVERGFKAIISSGWYLDQQKPSAFPTNCCYFFQDTWTDFYRQDIFAGLGNLTDAQKKLVIGGEVCQWGETANPYNIDGAVWTRAAAVAERLWSDSSANDTNEAYFRLARYQCHIIQRGVRASPFRPNHCPSGLLDTVTKPLPAGNVVVPLWVVIVLSILFVIAITVAIGLAIKISRMSRPSSGVYVAVPDQ